MADEEFPKFLEALRQHDPQAFDQLVERSGPSIRALIRSWLGRAQLRRVVDSLDIWQSILLNLDQCLQSGQFTPASFAQLHSYLRSMARNKFCDVLRREQAAKRQLPPVGPGRHRLDSGEVADPGSSPSQQVAYAELWEQFQSRLSAEARRIYEWKALGWTWPQIAAELGGLPIAVRIRFDREIQRVAREMGLCKEGAVQE
jgi:RNA polymerase sigma factor (sigma-70 family)